MGTKKSVTINKTPIYFTFAFCDLNIVIICYNRIDLCQNVFAVLYVCTVNYPTMVYNAAPMEVYLFLILCSSTFLVLMKIVTKKFLFLGVCR